MSYDPHSPDAMFSRIIQRLDEQDRQARDSSAQFLTVLGEIRDEVRKTNGRVSAIERWRDVITAKTAGIAAGASAVVSLALWLLKNG